MKGKSIMVVGVLIALMASFMIISTMPVTVDDFEGDLTVDGTLNVTGTGEFGGSIDMNHNYILESDFTHELHFSMTGGATDIELKLIPDGLLIQDRHFHRIGFAVDTAPGEGKECNVTLTNGNTTMFVDLVDAETSDVSTANEFDLDVSAETLTLTYSQSAGGAATRGFIIYVYHLKENE